MPDLAELVGQVVGSYPQLAPAKHSISSWASFNDKFTVSDVNIGHACHASMQSGPKGCTQVITSYPIKDKILDTRWFDFMRDHLFADYKDHIHLAYTDEGEAYIHLKELGGVPANIVYNLCITSRIPMEFRYLLKVWQELMDVGGLSPAMAYICMGTASGSDVDKKVLSLFGGVTNTNHWPIDHSSSVPFILAGTVCQEMLSANFKENPAGCYPCNRIWYDGKQTLRGLQGSSIREFSDRYKTKEPPHEDVLQSS